MRLGKFMIGMLIFRLIWGFIGPRHARFGNFIKGPGSVLRYLKGGITSVGPQSLGRRHGGADAAAAGGAGQRRASSAPTTSSVCGPYFPSVSQSWPSSSPAIHHWNFNFILAAIALHLCAIVYYTFVKKERLVPAMFHGGKPAS